MAPVAAAILAAVLVANSAVQVAAANFVRAAVDILNLRYADIDPVGQAGLSRGYAIDIAAAISAPVTDVRSLDGSFASVTVSQGVNLLPGGSTHNDLLPETTVAPPAGTSRTAPTTPARTRPERTTAAPTTAAPTTAAPSTTAPTTAAPEANTTAAPPPATTSPPEPTIAPSTTTRAPTVWTTRQPVSGNDSTAEVPSLWPMRGIAYGALPCKGDSCLRHGLPSQDMVQGGYAQQWGEAGRDDLGLMKAMGGNAVRMYHSFGLNTKHPHGPFLDRAKKVGVNVMPGFHTELTGECPDFDCFHAWKEATLKGFQRGYQQGSAWHPAVSMVILLNEPDFLHFSPQCQGHPRGPGPWCHVKAGLSALDGVLAAEKEAGMYGGPNLTIAWSFGMSTSIDGKVTGPGYFGFQDMLAGVANASLAYYTPRSTPEEMMAAYKARWVNCLNTQAPWGYVNSVIGGNYEPFKPAPWFIGEYGANGQPRHVIEDDLKLMEREAAKKEFFMGVTFFQFQTANQKGGSELNFGMFDLGTQQIAETGEVCDDGMNCLKWPVYCLTPNLEFLPGTLKDRAEAVAVAWNGTLAHASVCDSRRGSDRRLTSTAFSRLGFYVRIPAGMTTADVSTALAAPTLQQQLMRRTAFELGANSPAIAGTLIIGGTAFEEESSSVVPNGNQGQATHQPVQVQRGLPWWAWVSIAACAGLLAISAAAVACCVVRGKVVKQQSMDSHV